MVRESAVKIAAKKSERGRGVTCDELIGELLPVLSRRPRAVAVGSTENREIIPGGPHGAVRGSASCCW